MRWITKKAVSTDAQAKISIGSFLPFSTASTQSGIGSERPVTPKLPMFMKRNTRLSKSRQSAAVAAEPNRIPAATIERDGKLR
jgi:hypothetical protein